MVPQSAFQENLFILLLLLPTPTRSSLVFVSAPTPGSLLFRVNHNVPLIFLLILTLARMFWFVTTHTALHFKLATTAPSKCSSVIVSSSPSRGAPKKKTFPSIEIGRASCRERV